MTAEPRLEYRKEQDYAAVRTQLSIPFGDELPALWGEVAGYLEHADLAPSGAPFIRYLTIDMPKKLELEVGFPIPRPVAGNGRVRPGKLPAGRYAVLLYTGPYDDLEKVTAGLLDWARLRHINWQTTMLDNIEWWASRLEWYPTDPSVVSDPLQYQTELAFLTAEV